MMRFGSVCLMIVALLSCRQDDNKMFTRLSPDKTGITFLNINVENEAVNIFTYEYLYNGGGVALGDINNDGLTDIYFSSNNRENILYLNKGDFKFEDITQKAGVGCKPGWKTGVSMVDINADGYLDIYVCRSADFNPQNRKNILLINNGDLTFTDRANEYGLDDNSYTTQASFFDYDNDGDLDAFLINHSLLQISNSFNISSFNKKMRYPYVGNKLLRNDDGHFKDVSDSLGIYGPSSNYGLGIGVSDFNNDGWKDVYTSNDYVDNDKMYINNHGEFTEMSDSLLTHVSQFSMGLDIVDINGDGLMDIFTLDMLPEDNKRQKLLFGPDRYDVFATSVRNGYHYQYMRNMLHLNNGDGTFSEIGQFAGISNTDWSWSPLFADYDNDGFQDLFVSNGYKRDFTNNDFLKYRADQEIKSRGGAGQKEKHSEMIKKMPANKLHNYMFSNNGDITFKDRVVDWGFEDKLLTNGAAYADLDNDGDLDLVMNNIDEVASVYRNNSEKLVKNNFLKIRLEGEGKNKLGVGSRVVVYQNGKKLVRELYPVRGFQSSVEPTLHFGLGSVTSVDSVVVLWPLGETQKVVNVKANQLLTLNQKDTKSRPVESIRATPFFTEEKNSIAYNHKENDFIDFKIQVLLPRMYSTQGPALASTDVNGDNLTDLFTGGAKGQSCSLFIQQKNGSFKNSSQPDFLKDNASECVDAVFFDADKDGDNDLYVVSGGYEFEPDDKALADQLFINDGRGNFSKSPEALPEFYSSGSCARPADIDGDGDLDLFVGGRLVPGRYPETPASYILINDGKGKFADQTDAIAPAFKSLGLITDALWTDLNKDGTQDLVVVGEWTPIMFFVNSGGKLVDSSSAFLKESSNGWWNCIVADDIDDDGDMDIIAGNLGLNNQMKPTEVEPVTMIYDDFDKNGSLDPVLSYFIQHKSYPYPNRDELTDQVPSIKKKFTDYESYSNAQIENILTADQLKNAKSLKANRFNTSLLRNNGDGTFTSMALPAEAQYAPVFSIVVMDVNDDGKKDMVMGGNLEKTRVRTGKFAGSFGAVLMGDGKCNFSYVPQLNSGLCIKGDVRKIIRDKDRLFFGINNSGIRVYENSKN